MGKILLVAMSLAYLVQPVLGFAQTISQFEFGPSPRSIDYHEMFKPENLSKWVELRKRANWFSIHQLAYLRKASPEGEVLATSQNNAAWTGLEAIEAARVLNGLNFNVSTFVSSGLLSSGVCDSLVSDWSLTPAQIGQRAALFEFNQMATLRSAGIRISRLYVDGPFLHVLQNTSKDASCNSYRTFMGTRGGRELRGPTGAAAIVHEYLKALQGYFPDAQIVLTLNILNWKQGALAPLAWAQAGYRLDEMDDLGDVLNEFLNYYNSGRAGYRLAGIQFDAPWSYVGKTSTTTGNFWDRVDGVYSILRNRLGVTVAQGMLFSFISNSESRYREGSRFFVFRRSPAGQISSKYDPLRSEAEVCALAPAVLDASGTVVLTAAQNRTRCLNNDSSYFADSQNYATSISDARLSDSRVSQLGSVEISYGSWHIAPRESVVGDASYLDFVKGDVDRIDPGLQIANSVAMRRLPMIAQAFGAVCTPRFRQEVGALGLHSTLTSRLCNVPSTVYDVTPLATCRTSEYLAIRPDVKQSSFGTNPLGHWTAYGQSLGLCKPEYN